MKLVFDVESNHYDFKKLHTLHCLVAQDVDTEVIYKFVGEDIKEGIKLLMEADELIAHNGIRFDIPALQMFYPQFKPTATISDTLVMSRLGKPKWFTHKLEHWGRVLHFKKGDYAEKFKEEAGDTYETGDEWQTFNQPMLDYCVQDVRVNRRVYLELSKCMPTMFSREVLELEQYTTELMEKQKKVGVGFDKEKATKLMLHLMDRREELDAQLRESFGGFYKRGKEFTPKKSLKRLHYTAGSPMTKIIWTKFSPTSRDHISYWLQKKYNWVPTDFTDGGKPKVSETVLQELASVYPEAEPLAEHFMVSKRLSAISEGKGSWFNTVGSDGRIHGNINPQGTSTYRATHSRPNMSQVPSLKKPYGAECREIFSPSREGFVNLGVDMSGIEARLLGHYCYKFDDGLLNDVILHGDIHSENQKAAGLPTRDLAKTFFYSLMYGAGDAHIGAQLGGDMSTGRKARAKFMKNMPAYSTLVSRVSAFRKANNGFIRALDGRMVPVEAEHTVLNYLLQSAGAILSKKWMEIFHYSAETAGFTWGVDYFQWGYHHDEIQVGVAERRAEELGRICVESIKEAGEFYKLNIPLTGEAIIGRNWAECH